MTVGEALWEDRERWWRDLDCAPRDGTRIELRFVREGYAANHFARFSPPGTAPNVWRLEDGGAWRVAGPCEIAIATVGNGGSRNDRRL